MAKIATPATPGVSTTLRLSCKYLQVALSLAERQANRVDPFKQGFAHGADELDLMSVRLCFQASVKILTPKLTTPRLALSVSFDIIIWT